MSRKHSERILIVVISIVLAAITVAVYWPVVTCEFVNFDDPEYVYQNRQVLAGLSWSGWIYAWTRFDCSNWHPLTWLSLEFDGGMWGLNPLGYHVTNLVLHVLNVVLIFIAFYQMTKTLYRCAFVAAFFALHPLHVESVAWISERKDVLSTFLLLLTVLAYVQYAKRPSVMRYSVILALFGLGLLAKPMLVTAPVLFMLLDFWPLNRVIWNNTTMEDNGFLRRPIQSLILEKLPFFGLAFADGLMTVFAQRDAAKMLAELTLGNRIANMFQAYSWYLHKTLVPTNLTVFYPHPAENLSWPLVAIGLATVLGISVWVLYHCRNKPHLAFGWLWFVISLLPVIGLLQVGGQAYADRYAYVPHVGLFVPVIWEVAALRSSAKVIRNLLDLVIVSALITCGLLTRVQIQYWRTSNTLWTHALAVTPESGVAHAHLADRLLDEGEYERAIKHIERAIQLKRSGNLVNAYCNWGKCLLALNRPAEAEEKFLAALKIDGYHEVSLSELLKLLRSQGRETDAKQVSARQGKALQRQVEKNPDDATSQLNLGLWLARRGEFKQAVDHFEKAVRIAPQSAAAHNNLALAQLQLSLKQEAKANFLKALQLNPDLAIAHFNFASILEAENDQAGARKHFSEALRINPNDHEAKQSLERLSPH